jgi:hypothetical protein
MIIGCRSAVKSIRVLVVCCLRSKIIKREDLHLARVGGWAVLERCGDCQAAASQVEVGQGDSNS